MSYLEINQVIKKFGDVLALNGVGFKVSEGEFFTLLGPSGCGKTTLLRCIAGFESIDSGEIKIAGRDISHVPPEHRDMGFVFQRYALFPTMSVQENVAFGLKMRRVETSERDRRVADAIAKVGLSGLEQRKPGQLSGGQQQRVALARALVIEPHILLLDEPLSNLDANLRIEMRTEIRRLQREVGITTLYVTHDQEEAFAISDRVLVLSQGRAQQLASPQELYFKPANKFVAGFIGQTNLFTGKYQQRVNGHLMVEFGAEVLALDHPEKLTPTADISFSVRPERVRLSNPEQGDLLRGKIRQREFRGASMFYQVDCDGQLVLAEAMALSQYELGGLFHEGDQVGIRFDPADCSIIQS